MEEVGQTEYNDQIGIDLYSLEYQVNRSILSYASDNSRIGLTIKGRQ